MRIKLFFKIFVLLLTSELIIGIADAYFHQNGTDLLGIQLNDLTNVLVVIMSMPISVFGRDLPFYHIETWVAMSLTILNIVIQTYIVFRIYLAFRK